MKMSISPVTAAVMAAAAVTVEFVVVVLVSSRVLSWPAAVNLALFLGVFLYAVFLSTLSGRALRALLPPLMILATVLPAARSPAAFVVPAAAVLSWVRSGVCFQGPLRRRMASETLASAAGFAAAALMHPLVLTEWAIFVWMFFLVQSLYFLVIDPGDIRSKADPALEREESVRARAAELLRQQRLERVFAELELSSCRDSDRLG